MLVVCSNSCATMGQTWSEHLPQAQPNIVGVLTLRAFRKSTAFSFSLFVLELFVADILPSLQCALGLFWFLFVHGRRNSGSCVGLYLNVYSFGRVERTVLSILTEVVFFLRWSYSFISSDQLSQSFFKPS